jgi:hypothetical protein
MSDTDMKLPPFIIIALTATAANLTFGQTGQNEPTRQEIAEAYRSKSGEGGIFIPAVRWERWRIRDVRGWSLRFKRVKESRNVGVLTLQYRVLAEKAGSCAEYQVTDTMPIPGNVQIQPILVVDPGAVHACR